MKNRTHLLSVDHGEWTSASAPAVQRAATDALERGAVVFLPGLPFDLRQDERGLCAPLIAATTSKNISFDPSTGHLAGTLAREETAARLRALLERFSDAAAALVAGLFPTYDRYIVRGRASFRPVEIAGRHTSWRKDDTRLHIDSFPASPVRGRRILRVFANVDPQGRPRKWRLGDEFPALAAHFAPDLRLPLPGSGAVLHWLHVTKTRRASYDFLMLQLHDHMKADEDYQRNVPQTACDFPAGTTWIAFTDQVSHAAMSGQHQLEQTLLLPVEALQDESRAPLRVLERLKGRLLT